MTKALRIWGANLARSSPAIARLAIAVKLNGVGNPITSQVDPEYEDCFLRAHTKGKFTKEDIALNGIVDANVGEVPEFVEKYERTLDRKRKVADNLPDAKKSRLAVMGEVNHSHPNRRCLNNTMACSLLAHVCDHDPTVYRTNLKLHANLNQMLPARLTVSLWDTILQDVYEIVPHTDASEESRAESGAKKRRSLSGHLLGYARFISVITGMEGGHDVQRLSVCGQLCGWSSDNVFEWPHFTPGDSIAKERRQS
ncbi:hypothetical protein H4582DRAFT_2128264 [Lactarius indigo]|nr:hypothetical protein H4582DRAFT_2128264 [Lactarius indigo]